MPNKQALSNSDALHAGDNKKTSVPALPTRRHTIRITTIILLALLGLVFAGIFTFLANQTHHLASEKLHAAQTIRLYAESIPKNTFAAIAGQAPAFEELERTSISMQQLLVEADTEQPKVLRWVSLPSFRETDIVAKINQIWEIFLPDIDLIITQKEGLLENDILLDPDSIELAKSATVRIIERSPDLTLAAEQLITAYQKTQQKTPYLMYALIALSFSLVFLVLFVIEYISLHKQKHTRVLVRNDQLTTERKVFQKAILRLMNELEIISTGDLSKRATVDEAVTGSLADSVNLMIESLSSLVKQVSQTTINITKASDRTRSMIGILRQSVNTQTQRVQDGGSQILEVTRSFKTISGKTSLLARASNYSLETASEGKNAIRNSIRGMQDIRLHIQDTSKRMKRLGESSQEIGEIVQLISDLSEQTNVLALNAAIQASAAGQAGKGFGVVAEEVKQLANRSVQATQKISQLIKAIQAETKDTIHAMNRSTTGVVQGAQLVDQANSALDNITSASQNVAKLVEDINQTTKNQASKASFVIKNMQEMLSASQKSKEQTQITMSSMDDLNRLADKLNQSIAGFKL